MSESVTVYQCPRCKADPQPQAFGSPRRCAFLADGNFTADNWSCATIDALLDIIAASTQEGEFDEDGLDESIQGVRCEPEQTGGWIVMARYKHRGKMSRAIHFGYSTLEPLTLRLAEETIAHHMAMAERDQDSNG